MNKTKNWMEGFASKEEELAYWKEEGKKYKAWLNSEKNIKRSKKPPYGYNPNDNEFNIDFH